MSSITSSLSQYHQRREQDRQDAYDIDEISGLLFEVEGNIGCGKSTLTSMIKKWIDGNALSDSDVTVFSEFNNPDFLAAFYSDMKRFSFAFQTFMLASRRYQLMEGSRRATIDEHTVFLDRGAVGDTLFAMVGLQNGHMQQEEFDIYKSVCQESLPATLADKVDVVLFLDVDYQECHRRITTLRKDKAEDGIPLAYLEQLDKTYFYLMIHWMSRNADSQSEFETEFDSTSEQGINRTFHDMNVGEAPPVVVIRWDKYGTVRSVVHELAELARGHRKSPKVRFKMIKSSTATTNENEKEKEVEIIPRRFVIGSSDTMDEIYQALSEEPDDDDYCDSIDISWKLPHTNAYRRVVYYYLSKCYTINFF